MSNTTKEHEAQLMYIHGKKVPAISNTSTYTLPNIHNVRNKQNINIKHNIHNKELIFNNVSDEINYEQYIAYNIE